MSAGVLSPDALDIIEDHNITIDTEGCWLWGDGVDTTKGYGRLVKDGARWRAHRYVWSRLVGPLSDGMVLGHVCHDVASHDGKCRGGVACKHRRCVNPDHLQEMTPEDNIRSSAITRHKRGPVMGTTAEEQPEYRGIIAKAGHQYEVITTVMADTTYGRRGGYLYPVVLLAVIALALVLTGGDVALVAVGLLSILLLGIWVGGGGGRR